MKELSFSNVDEKILIISENKLKKREAIEQFIQLREKYVSKEGYWNEISSMTHQGKTFYLSYNDDFFGPLKELFHQGFPLYLSFIKDGEVNWISTFYDNFAKVEFNLLKEQKAAYIKKSKEECDKAGIRVNIWLKNNKIERGKEIIYYRGL